MVRDMLDHRPGGNRRTSGSPPPERTGRAGFTVMELLVVIALISILASVLLVALATSRESARNAACRNNLRQVWIAVMDYAGDHGGYVKPFYATVVQDINRPYGPYVVGAIMQCPSEAPETGQELPFGNECVYVHYAAFSHFGLGVSFRMDMHRFQGDVQTRVYASDKVMIFGEGIPPEYGYHWFHETACPWDTSARFRHMKDAQGGQMNIVYADGVVREYKETTVPDPANPAKPPEPPP